MGYTTDFTGSFKLDKPLKPEHAAYLTKFAETRRMKRVEVRTAGLTDPLREAVGLPVGDEGGYFVGSTADFGQDYDCPSVVDSNRPPKGQPGLWCQWVPTADASGIEWNGTEKFYRYVDWLNYILVHFLGPWGYTLNGEVEWQGEDDDDKGVIVVKDNVVEVKKS